MTRAAYCIWRVCHWITIHFGAFLFWAVVAVLGFLLYEIVYGGMQ